MTDRQRELLKNFAEEEWAGIAATIAPGIRPQTYETYEPLLRSAYVTGYMAGFEDYSESRPRVLSFPTVGDGDRRPA